MDILKLETYFHIEPDEPYSNQPVVRIWINDQDLIKLVRPIELIYEPEIAGEYKGLYSHEIFWPCKRLLGDPEYHFLDDNRVGLLQCTCGEEGCWSLMAKISFREKMVVWSDFKHNHRPEWDYVALGPFIFSKEQYLEELRVNSDGHT